MVLFGRCESVTTPVLSIHPVHGPVRGVVRPPGSKSITNRAVVCAALADGSSVLHGVLDSDDTRVMFTALEQLGVAIAWDREAAVMRIVGSGGRLRPGPLELYAENSGTTLRFLAAVVALGQGLYRLDGNARMRQRPIAGLIDALGRLGVSIHAESDTGCPPIRIDAVGIPGGRTLVAGDVSSQFLSGLLLAAPYAANVVDVQVSTELVSSPYVAMTESVMEAFGVRVKSDSGGHYRVLPAKYHGRDYSIEPDASAATYFWGAAAVTGGEVTVDGLSRASLQGDTAFVDCLAGMGCEVQESQSGLLVRGGTLRGIDVDLRDLSDTVPTLAVVALFADGPTTIRGVSHVRHKESDRLGDLARELRRLGANVEEHSDGLTITPGTLRGSRLATYDDHRLAMAFALVGLRVPGVEIENPECTAKTYPRFFEALERMCG